MPGPRKKPRALSVLKGNPEHRPVNKNEPVGTRGVPKCPAWLTLPAQKAWKQMGALLDEMRVINLEDRIALELLCNTYSIWLRANKVINRRGVTGGLTYKAKTEHGERSLARPEVAIEADSMRRIKAMLSEFGLTPATRSKVKSSPAGKGGALDDFM